MISKPTNKLGPSLPKTTTRKKTSKALDVKKTDKNQYRDAFRDDVGGYSVRKTVIIMGSLLAAALLALTFIGGFVAGKKSVAHKLAQADLRRKQLTDNLDRPIRERPLLKNLSQKTKGRLKNHGLAGSLIEVGEDALVVDSPDGARSVLVDEQTKILEGKSKKPITLNDLRAGSKILVLGGPDNSKQSDAIHAKVIIVNPENKPGPQSPNSPPSNIKF